jgi:hypothetical protein
MPQPNKRNDNQENPKENPKENHKETVSFVEAEPLKVKELSGYSQIVNDAFPNTPKDFNKDLESFLEQVNVKQRMDSVAVEINNYLQNLVIKHKIDKKQETLLRNYQVFLRENKNHDGFYLIGKVLELRKEKENNS